MKHHFQNNSPSFPVLYKAAFAVALLALLHGCASEQPKKVEIQPDIKPAVIIPPVVLADFETAMAFVKSEEYEKSIPIFNKIIQDYPNNAIPYINLALVYKKLGQFELAENHLKLALNVDHENPVANNEYALLLRKTGRFAEARKLYEKTLDTYPNFDMAHKNLGILCDLYMKDYACAMKHYGIYSKAKPDDKNVRIWITDLKNRMKQ